MERENDNRDATCLKCGWVSRVFTKAEALKISPDTQWTHGCPMCGSLKFRPTIEGDCPVGCTIQGIYLDKKDIERLKNEHTCS